MAILTLAAAVLALAVPALATDPGTQAAARTTVYQYCEDVPFVGTEDSRVTIHRRKDKPAVKCKRVRQVAAHYKRPPDGWKCQRFKSQGYGSVVLKCTKPGYSLRLQDLTPNIAQRYSRDTDTVSYNYGAALNRYAHRICVLYNESDGEKQAYYRGSLPELENTYNNLAIDWTYLTGRSLPSAQEQRKCLEPPTRGDEVLPLRYKPHLGAIGGGATYYARDGLPDQAAWSELARQYNELRDVTLQLKPDSDVVMFSQFQRLMGVKYLPAVLPEPEPTTQDPPCRQSQSCGY